MHSRTDPQKAKPLQLDIAKASLSKTTSTNQRSQRVE